MDETAEARLGVGVGRQVEGGYQRIDFDACFRGGGRSGSIWRNVCNRIGREIAAPGINPEAIPDDPELN